MGINIEYTQMQRNTFAYNNTNNALLIVIKINCLYTFY